MESCNEIKQVHGHCIKTSMFNYLLMEKCGQGKICRGMYKTHNWGMYNGCFECKNISTE